MCLSTYHLFRSVNLLCSRFSEFRLSSALRFLVGRTWACASTSHTEAAWVCDGSPCSCTSLKTLTLSDLAEVERFLLL